jgi:hypothetical protein
MIETAEDIVNIYGCDITYFLLLYSDRGLSDAVGMVSPSVDMRSSHLSDGAYTSSFRIVLK